MFWINIRRVIKSGFVNFWRNSVVSFAAVLIMTVTLFVIGSILFTGALLDESLTQLNAKVDINIYFTLNAGEEDIQNLKSSLEKLPEVAEVTYTTREQAIEDFKKRHENDYLTLQALDELGENPLGASLSIRAKETSQYEGIAGFIESEKKGETGAIIDTVNYYQNKESIDKLTSIISGARAVGIAITLLLAALSVVIVFNTIRLAIYTAREEISVMRLVGASGNFVRGPFLIEGLMYGVIAGVLSLILFYPATLWLGAKTELFFGGINLFHYYTGHFGEIFLIIMGSGIVLGVFSSFLAVRQYLRI